MSQKFVYGLPPVTFEVVVQLDKYTNGQNCIILLHADTDLPLETVSISKPGMILDEHDVIVKDHAMSFLVDNNIAIETDEYVDTDDMLCPVLKLRPQQEWKPALKHFNVNGMSFQARDYYDALDLYELAMQAQEIPF
jgi:hypothetical protein